MIIKKEKMSKRELEIRVKKVERAFKELRNNPSLVEKIEKILVH